MRHILQRDSHSFSDNGLGLEVSTNVASELCNCRLRVISGKLYTLFHTSSSQPEHVLVNPDSPHCIQTFLWRCPTSKQLNWTMSSRNDPKSWTCQVGFHFGILDDPTCILEFTLKQDGICRSLTPSPLTRPYPRPGPHIGTHPPHSSSRARTLIPPPHTHTHTHTHIEREREREREREGGRDPGLVLPSHAR